MNGSNINSLYSLIKQESQKKAKKLKIICDWDECLQPFNVLILYKVITQARNTKESKEEFDNFFESFHNNNEINIDYSDHLPFAAYERDENGEYK